MATIRPLAARIFRDETGIDLDGWIAAQRDNETPLRTIAARLADLTGGDVDVTAQTILNWSNDREPAA